MQIKNTEILQKIEKTGLTDKEAKVYVALLELGGAYPSRISEYTGLNRTTVYDVLLVLSVKGLVNEIEKKNKQFYQIEKPRKLLRLAEGKVSIAKEEYERAEKIIPDIEGLYNTGINKPKVLYFEGLEGVMSVYEDHVRVSKPYEMRAWANARALETLLPEKFFKWYRETKQEKKITTKGILPDTSADLGFLERTYKNFLPEIIPNIKYIPSEIFPYKAEVTIYGENKVSIINLGHGAHSGVIIEDPTIYGLMGMVFELSWSAAKELDSPLKKDRVGE